MKTSKQPRGQRNKHPKLADELDRRLAAFERWKKRIDQLAKEAPEQALREIKHGAFQRGRHICAKVIEHQGYENEPGRGAVIYLVSHLGYLLEEVEEVARAGSPNALAFLWHHATRLCWLLDDVARSEPERLKNSHKRLSACPHCGRFRATS
ncbi:MAG: hypothetical protein NT105_11480 [Verrucomicrobia bacterium]|nr:hypothetical protein [Verrucomicrobiota bacterium]